MISGWEKPLELRRGLIPEEYGSIEIEADDRSSIFERNDFRRNSALGWTDIFY